MQMYTILHNEKIYRFMLLLRASVVVQSTVMSKRKVTKAVIAAAGFGTRFLPQTKAMPKEMLPLVDKPIIQQIVEELSGAGITDIVIVTGYHKRTLEDHFDRMSSDLRSCLLYTSRCV